MKLLQAELDRVSKARKTCERIRTVSAIFPRQVDDFAIVLSVLKRELRTFQAGHHVLMGESRMRCALLSTVLVVALGLSMTASAAPYTYHGQLRDGSKPVSGTVDLQLTLYSSQTGGSVVAGPVTVYNVDVHNGTFSTSVDFGSLTTAAQGWVDTKISTAGSGDFASLDGRSPVAPSGTCPGSWNLDGNAALPVDSYLGTSDNESVYIAANGGAVAVFNPNGSTGISDPYVANGAFSTAIGFDAGTNFNGSTVIEGFQDSTFGNSIRDSNTNQLIVVAQNGMGLNTSIAPDGLPLHDELTIAPTANLPGSNADITLETAVGAAGSSAYVGFNMNAEPDGFFNINGLFWDGTNLQYQSLLRVDYLANDGGYWSFNNSAGGYPIDVGNNSENGNGAHLTQGGVWTNASSRTFKDTFAAIDPVNVLEKLVAMPVMTWFYKGNHSDGLHMGPVAEDFASTFSLGQNEKYIGTSDEGGVALAAIQGLNKKLETENAQLRSQLESLSERMAKIEKH